MACLHKKVEESKTNDDGCALRERLNNTWPYSSPQYCIYYHLLLQEPQVPCQK